MPWVRRRALRWRTLGCTRRCSPASRSCGARAGGSSKPRRASGDASSATCTMARSSGWSHCRCGSACWRRGSAPTPRRAGAVAQARSELGESLSELRELARGIHPAVVTGHGLAAALEGLAARAPVPVRVTVDLDARLPEPIELAAYFLVSEGLTNVAKYARASTASIDVTRGNGDLVVEVSDDGVGGANADDGTGLRGLADRVEALGGCLRLESPAGGGTRMRAQIPCA